MKMSLHSFWRCLTLVFVIGALGLALGGCVDLSDVRSRLGLERKAADEFSVITRAPLSMPPDFSLRPPQEGSERPPETSITEEVRRTVFDLDQSTPPSLDETMPDDGRSVGERALVREVLEKAEDPEASGTLRRSSAARLPSASSAQPEETPTPDLRDQEEFDPYAESERLRAQGVRAPQPR